MLAKKFDDIQRFIKHELRELKRNRGAITENEFDAFTGRVLSNAGLDTQGKIYCRDGCAFADVAGVERVGFR
jgi:hypothetical protein